MEGLVSRLVGLKIGEASESRSKVKNPKNINALTNA